MGHGHPLRPEYILTEDRARLAAASVLDAELLKREVLHGFPPTSSYRASAKGARRLVRYLDKVANALAVPAPPAEPSSPSRRQRRT